MASDNPPAREVQEYLSGIDFPASAQDIREHAKEHGAADNKRVWSFFEQIPDKQYEQITDVSKELGNYADSD